MHSPMIEALAVVVGGIVVFFAVLRRSPRK